MIDSMDLRMEQVARSTRRCFASHQGFSCEGEYRHDGKHHATIHLTEHGAATIYWDQQLYYKS